MRAEKPERRSSRRFEWRLPVSLRYGSGGGRERDREMANTRDISARGVFLFSDKKLEKGSEIELIFIMPPDIQPMAKQWVCCKARVVRVEDREAGKQFGVAANIERCEALEVI